MPTQPMDRSIPATPVSGRGAEASIVRRAGKRSHQCRGFARARIYPTIRVLSRVECGHPHARQGMGHIHSLLGPRGVFRQLGEVMRVAILRDWLVASSGAGKVLELIVETRHIFRIPNSRVDARRDRPLRTPSRTYHSRRVPRECRTVFGGCFPARVHGGGHTDDRGTGPASADRVGRAGRTQSGYPGLWMVRRHPEAVGGADALAPGT